MARAFADLLKHYRTERTTTSLQRVGSSSTHRMVTTELSQNQLAAMVPINPGYLSLMESGRRTPKREVIEALAERLDLDEHQRAQLLTAAGLWPWPGLDDEQTDLILAAAIAIIDGDWRVATAQTNDDQHGRESHVEASEAR